MPDLGVYKDLYDDIYIDFSPVMAVPVAGDPHVLQSVPPNEDRQKVLRERARLKGA